LKATSGKSAKSGKLPRFEAASELRDEIVHARLEPQATAQTQTATSSPSYLPLPDGALPPKETAVVSTIFVGPNEVKAENPEAKWTDSVCPVKAFGTSGSTPTRSTR
jgi:hypothetical protein